MLKTEIGMGNWTGSSRFFGGTSSKYPMYHAVYLSTGRHPLLLGISQAAAMIFNPNGSKGLRSKGVSLREKEEAESDAQEGISWPAI